jgi:5'-phosphate synthase pdxT subunit
LRVGVFALQGDVREHLQLLTSLGVESIEVRNAEQLASCDGLIIPGGESTTISKLIDIFGLRDDLLA